jgi:MSHA pilin protein MshA
MLNKKYKTQLKHQGFTLIELVIVIVILGILAATAAPKFINIKTESNEAVLKAMGGAILSAANQVYAKSVIQGVNHLPLTNIDLDGDSINDVEIKFGYPSAHRQNSIPKIMGSNFTSQWTWSTVYKHKQFLLTTSTLGGGSGEYVNNTRIKNSGCYITYDFADIIDTLPVVSYVTTKC